MKLPCVELRRERGFSMIEVMITFFVLSIGLLGMAALQIKAVQYNQGAMIRSQAMSAANDIVDRMRLNMPDVNANNYKLNMGQVPPSGVALYAQDLRAWRQFVGNNLPNGDSSISCSSNVCTIAIRWADRFGTSTTLPATCGTGTGYECFVLTTQI